MKKRSLIISSIIFIILALILYIGLYKYTSKSYSNNITPTKPLDIRIISSTASSTDELVLNLLRQSNFKIKGSEGSKVELGSIVLKKEVFGYTDFITYAYTIDSKNIKKTHLLVFRDVMGDFKLTSSSQIEGARKIVGLRADEIPEAKEYYVDVQFISGDTGNESQGVIKKITVDGIE